MPLFVANTKHTFNRTLLFYIYNLGKENFNSSNYNNYFYKMCIILFENAFASKWDVYRWTQRS